MYFSAHAQHKCASTVHVTQSTRVFCLRSCVLVMENTTQQQQQPPPPQQQQYVQEQYQQQQYFAGDAGQPMAVGVQQDGAQVVDQSGTAFGDGQEFPGSLQVSETDS